MKQKLKESLLKRYGAKLIKKKDWDIIYGKLTSVYGVPEIPKVIEQFDSDITLFEPPMEKWKVKDKIGWYIDQLILKESTFRTEKTKKYHSEVFDPNEYSPLIKGIQVKPRSTFFDKILEMEKEECIESV